MSYTHYYDHPEHINPETFALMRHDIQRIVTAAQEAGLPLAGWNGVGKPEFEADLVAFNGKADCGHVAPTTVTLFVDPSTHPGLAFRWTTGNASREATGQTLRRCDGSCSLGNFVLYQSCTPSHREVDPSWWPQVLTKTNLFPYDLVVTAALIAAKHHLGSGIQIRSDGEDRDWEDARQICQAVLGYGQEYHLGDDPEMAELTKVDPTALPAV